jgi:hypothetical protein
MNGARVGIAAQSLGIGEAAFRVAREYAASRKQFGSAIENFPAVRDLLMDMKINVEAARTLTYETTWVVDHENGLLRQIELGTVTDKERLKKLKNEEKKFKRLAGMLTPMSKYYASEMCNRVTYGSIQVLGGSGYMKDYAVERHARDARITTIYEGTSQLQVIAAVRGVCSGAAERYLLEAEAFPYSAEQADLVEMLKQCRSQLIDAIAFVKSQPGTEYMDLHGRKLVDIAIMLIVGHLFLQQSVAEPAWQDDFCKVPATGGNGKGSDNAAAGVDAYRTVRHHNRVVARRYIAANVSLITMLHQQIKSGDRSTMTDFDVVVGPVHAG